MQGQNDEKKRTARRQIKRVSANTSPESEVKQTVAEIEETVGEVINEKIEETVEIPEGSAAEPVEILEEAVEAEVEETPIITEEKTEEPELAEETVVIEKNEEESVIEIPQKMENPEAKSISVIRIGVVLLLVSAIVTLALSLVNFLTEGKIADNKANAMNAAVKEIFPDSTGSQEIDYVYSEPVAGVYEVMQNDTHIGYAVSVIPSGFGGDIEMLVGVDHKGEVAGVRILAMSETPNVGTKVNTSDYLSGYNGKTGMLTLGADIDAISGATVSSRAVLAGVNAVLTLELKVDGVVEDDEESDVTIDLGKEFPVDSALETVVIPSEEVPPVSYETEYREETSAPASEPNETSIIEIKTEPAETTAEPEVTTPPGDTETTAAETTGAEETTAPDETSAAA